MQDCNNSIADALKLLQSFIKLSISCMASVNTTAIKGHVRTGLLHVTTMCSMGNYDAFTSIKCNKYKYCWKCGLLRLAMSMKSIQHGSTVIKTVYAHLSTTSIFHSLVTIHMAHKQLPNAARSIFPVSSFVGMLCGSPINEVLLLRRVFSKLV